MIRPDRIKSEMLGGVGFRQPTLSGMPVIDTGNLASSSGLYYQDGASFVTIQNIIDCYQDPDVSDPDFNIYLDQMQEAVILESCQKICANQSDFIQSANLYPYEKLFKNTFEPSGKFAAFQIENTKRTSVLSKINWVELCFDSVATFNIYLYNSNLPKSPIKTQEVTTVANESIIVSLEDWQLADSETFKGGSFYWGYFEDDLGGAKALKKDYELSDYQVSTGCNYISPVLIDHSGTTLDLESVTDKSDTYGLNFCIDTYNDFTELLIRNKTQMFQVIQYQMAEKVFGLIRTAVRSNRTERITKDVLSAISFEIYGNREAGIEGINGKLKRAVIDLRKTFFPKSRISRRTLS